MPTVLEGPDNEFLHDLSKSFPMYRMKGFGKVYEDHVKVLKLLTALFLHLSGRKDQKKSMKHGWHESHIDFG